MSTRINVRRRVFLLLGVPCAAIALAILSVGPAEPFGARPERRLAAPIGSKGGQELAATPSPASAFRDSMAPAAPGRLVPGEDLLFRLVVEAGSGMYRMGDVAGDEESTESPEQLVMELQGDLGLHVLGLRDGLALAELRFERALLYASGGEGRLDHESLEDLARQLNTNRVLLQVRMDGTITGLRFPETLEMDARQWIRTLLISFRFVVPESVPDSQRWEVVEADTTGAAVCLYRRMNPDAEPGIPWKLSKSKQPYDVETLEGRRAESRYQGRASWSPAIGWIEHARVQERRRLEIPTAGVVVSYRFEGQLTLIAHRTTAATPLADDTWGGEWTSLEETPDGRELAKQVEDERRRKLLAGTTVDQLAEELNTLLALHGIDSPEVFAAVNRLAWLISIDPRAALQLEQLVLDGIYPEGAAALMLAALGQAATPAAQDVLARFVGNALLGPELRTHALRSVFQIGAPAEALRLQVLSIVENGAPSLVQGTAILLLGHLVDAASAEGTASADLLQVLLELEPLALESGFLGTWLAALGNSGSPAALVHVEPYLSDASPTVRSAALSALRSIDSPVATSLLIVAALQDPDLSLRLQAVEQLGPRGDATTETLVGLAMQDPSPEVRMAALFAMASNGEPTVLELEMIAWSAQHDPSQEVRELAVALSEGV